MPSKRVPLTRRLIERTTVPLGKAEHWLRDSIVGGFCVKRR